MRSSRPARFAQRQMLQGLQDFLVSYREHPATQHELLGKRRAAGDEDWLRFFQALEGLCASYRKALTDRVLQNEALESMRSLMGQVDLARGTLPNPTTRGNTTSRDMVARLCAGDATIDDGLTAVTCLTCGMTVDVAADVPAPATVLAEAA